MDEELITTEQIVKNYDESITKIAQVICQLADYRDSFEFMTSQKNDNGDTVLLANDALTKLGELLATCIVYKEEYEAELNVKK